MKDATSDAGNANQYRGVSIAATTECVMIDTQNDVHTSQLNGFLSKNLLHSNILYKYMAVRVLNNTINMLNTI